MNCYTFQHCLKPTEKIHIFESSYSTALDVLIFKGEDYEKYYYLEYRSKYDTDDLSNFYTNPNYYKIPIRPFSRSNNV